MWIPGEEQQQRLLGHVACELGPRWPALRDHSEQADEDCGERDRTPPMLPERAESMAALPASPKQPEQKKERRKQAAGPSHVERIRLGWVSECLREHWRRRRPSPSVVRRRTIVGVAVDVLTEIEIRRPRAEVAVFASDPDNAAIWYENIESVEWLTEKPAEVGSRIAFVARFLGRRLSYTYEIKALVPGERIVMATAAGPFPMETTYTWSDAPEDGTRMSLRNRGEPAGFSKIAAPVLTRAMKRANRKDLYRLKQILESRGQAF